VIVIDRYVGVVEILVSSIRFPKTTPPALHFRIETFLGALRLLVCPF
jgi:hypothetical protein